MKAGLVEELHKPARRNYPRRSFLIKDIDETWQADLVEMIPYAKQNKGFKYLLTVIDVFSKYAWTVPVKQNWKMCCSSYEIYIITKTSAQEFANRSWKRILQ